MIPARTAISLVDFLDVLTCIIHEVRLKSLKALPKKPADKFPEKQPVFEV